MRWPLPVIRGRYDLGMEPHTVVKNGSEVVGALRDQWQRLELVERAKKECSPCDGCGVIPMTTARNRALGARVWEGLPLWVMDSFKLLPAFKFGKFHV